MWLAASLGYSRSVIRIGVGAVVVAVAFLCAGVAQAELRTTKLARASGASPYADCPSAAPLVPAAEDEPTIVASRRKPSRVVVAWRQDGGGYRPVSDRAARSRDGGRSFGETFGFEGLTACDGGPQRYVHGTDPWLAQGARNTLWFAGLPFTSGNPGAVGVSRSTDGGASWSPVVFADEDDSELEYDDKPTLVASPRNPDRAWVSWVKLSFLLPTDLPQPPLNATAYVSRTDDGGSTWSPPVAVIEGGILSSGLEALFPTEIDRLPGGRLVLTVGRFVPDIGPEGIPCALGENCPGDVVFEAYGSDDGGLSWSPSGTVGRARLSEPPIPGAGGDDNRNLLFSTAVTPDGALWLTAYELDGESSSTIRLWRSPDGGRSWQSLPDPQVGRGLRLLPQITGGKSGLALLWRETIPDRPGWVRWRFAHSKNGRKWEEIGIGKPTDVRPQPNTPAGRALFLGHYFGLASAARDFLVGVSLGPPQARQGPTDVFVTRVRVTRAAR